MAQVKITSSGAALAGIELDNFATEETLVAILTQLTKGTPGTGASGSVDAKAALAEKAKNLLGDFAGPLEGIVGGFETLVPEVLAVEAAIKLLEFGLNTASKIMHGFQYTVGNLTYTFISGEKSMSAFVDAIAKGTAGVPILGEFMSLLSDGVKAIDGVNNTLLELTNIGANFNGSMSSLVISAADAGLSVSDFSRIIKENSEKLAKFGTVQDGVTLLTKVAGLTMSNYADDLADMGISLAQYNEFLPKILSIFGPAAKAHGASEADLTAAAIELTKNFQAMSDFTGKSRDQQAADLEKLTSDAAWQQELTHLGADASAGLLTIMNSVNNLMGNSYAELYKLSVLGMPPLNKELQTLLATTPGLSNQFEKMTALAESGAKGMDLTNKLNPILAQTAGMLIRSGQSFETVIKATTAGLTGPAADIAKAQAELLQNSQQFMQNGQFNEQLYAQKLDEASKSLAVSNKLNEFSTIISGYQAYFMRNVVGPLLDNITPVINDIVKQFGSIDVSDVIHNSIQQITDIVNGIGTWVTNNHGTIKTIVTGVISAVTTVISVVLDLIKWVYTDWDNIKFWLEQAAEAIGGLILAALAIGAVFAVIGVALWGLADLIGEVNQGFENFGAWVSSFFESDDVTTPSATKALLDDKKEDKTSEYIATPSDGKKTLSVADEHAPKQTALLEMIASHCGVSAKNSGEQVDGMKKLNQSVIYG